MLKETASQTAGPYLHIGVMPQDAGLDIRGREKLNVLAGPNVQGQRIREGTVIDGEGVLVATPWSRSGRPTRTASTTVRATVRTCRSIPPSSTSELGRPERKGGHRPSAGSALRALYDG